VRPLDRRERLALAAVVAFGLWLRILYVLEQRHDRLFDYPVVDEERYVAMARGLTLGYVEPRAWFHPPGLVYALSLVFRAFGDGLLAPRIVQACVSSATCLLAFVVARRFFSPRVAIGAATVCAFHGLLIFESYELLPPTWIAATALLALWLLDVARERRTVGTALAAGVSLGVSAVFAPTILPFAACAALWLRSPALALALVAGVAIPIAPVTAGNWQRSHEVVLVSSNGGLNFFLGNNADYDATLAIRPGHRWETLMDEPARAGIQGAAGASGYFTSKALAFFRDDPLAAATLFGRKLHLYFDGAELPRDTDIYAAREGSPLLSVLVSRGPPWLPDGLLVPLALLGAAFAWPRRRELFVLYAFAGLQAIVTAAFFVTARYRVPALPVLAMFACVGVGGILEGLGAAGTPRAPLARSLAGLAALVVACNLPTPESRVSYAAELDFYRGLASTRHERDPEGAIDFFRRSCARDPGDARPWFELGNTLAATHREREAVDAWSHAAADDPFDARPRRQTAVVLAKAGDLEGAIGALRANVDARAHDDAFYAPDHLELALLEARAHHPDAGVADLRAATRGDPRYVRSQLDGIARAAMDASPGDDFLVALADVAASVGKPDLAGTLRTHVTAQTAQTPGSL
jgi:tetratricopeptide (TPR) repeat protein